MLNRIALAVREVIHRIYAPLVASTVMVGVDDAVQERVAEEHVRMCHVYFRTEHLLTIRIFSSLHFTEKLKILLNAAVAPRALGSRNLDSSPSGTDFFLRLVVNISQALLNQELSPIIELVEIVRSISFVLPVETKPVDVILD